MILKKSKEILREHILCNHCLGRQFGKISTSTNQRRGEVIRNLLRCIYPDLNSNLDLQKPCFICGDIFERSDNVITKINPEFEFN
ncbi:MAG TPA: tRNA pseudouridine(54/55) synthase Pus10, partial [Methanofastidiosum sp.]|nr:tRNA pseudouridine(54/55) synthase Pus10 [Methanofastidiosum sp.]